jgi:O-antigen/teichoic acid export membrane protein
VQLAISDLMNTLIPTYLLLAGLTVLAAPYLLKLLVAPQFAGVTGFLIIGAAVELCRVLANVVSTTAHVKRNTVSLTVPYAIGALVVLSAICIAGVQGMQIRWAGIALVLGGATTVLTMLKVMFSQVRFKLDPKRCGASIAALAVMLSAACYMPIVAGVIPVVGMLFAMGAFAGGVLLAILWKSPAAQRLLDVQLRNH